MYSGAVPSELGQVVQMLRIADLLSMPKLMRRCSDMFERELSRLSQPFLGAVSASDAAALLNAARLVCMFEFQKGDASQRRIASLSSHFLHKYFSQLYLLDLSWMGVADFLSAIRDQAKAQVNVAIKQYLDGRRAGLTASELDLIATSIPPLDTQLALFCIPLALAKDSNSLYVNSLAALSAEFVWLTATDAANLPFEALMDLLKQDSLGVLHEDDVFHFLERVMELPQGTSWSARQKRRAWGSCRLAYCSPDLIPRALTQGASIERVKEALSSKRPLASDSVRFSASWPPGLLVLLPSPLPV